MTLWIGNGAGLKTGTFKNCTIAYPKSHNKCHILRWYEWDSLVYYSKFVKDHFFVQ